MSDIDRHDRHLPVVHPGWGRADDQDRPPRASVQDALPPPVGAPPTPESTWLAALLGSRTRISLRPAAALAAAAVLAGGGAVTALAATHGHDDDPGLHRRSGHAMFLPDPGTAPLGLGSDGGPGRHGPRPPLR